MFQLKINPYLCVTYHRKVYFYCRFRNCISVMSTPCKWIADDPIYCHFCVSVVRFYTPSTYCMYFDKIIFSVEIIFQMMNICFHTNRMFSFFSACLDLYEKQVNKVMSIKILIANFYVLCFNMYDIPAYEH